MAAVKDVVIIGGGIAGLSLAVALRRIDVGVRVIEKGDRSSRLGTGISLLGNALRALERIDLAETCIQAGYGYDCVKTRDRAGDLLSEIRPPRLYREDRPGAFGIMRPVLAEILEKTATETGARIDFGTTVVDMVQDEGTVTLVLSTGETVVTDLVVGADGVYSATRTAVFGDEHKPEYCGQGGIRYTARRPAEMDGVTFYRGETGAAVGAIPLSQEKCYYFVLESGERYGTLSQQEVAEIWKQRMSPFSARELIETAECAASNDSISYRPFDVLMMPLPWHRSRVVLIGDAVHSLSPQLTSGGGMAIEDAVVLADMLRQPDDLEAVLTEFGRRRERRVRPILETSLQICMNEQKPSMESHSVSMKLLQHGYALLAQEF